MSGGAQAGGGLSSEGLWLAGEEWGGGIQAG